MDVLIPKIKDISSQDMENIAYQEAESSRNINNNSVKNSIFVESIKHGTSTKRLKD